MAWAEQVANTRVHAGDQDHAIARFLVDGPPNAPIPRLSARLQVVGHPSGDKDRHGVAVRQPVWGRAILIGRPSSSALIQRTSP